MTHNNNTKTAVATHEVQAAADSTVTIYVTRPEHIASVQRYADRLTCVDPDYRCLDFAVDVDDGVWIDGLTDIEGGRLMSAVLSIVERHATVDVAGDLTCDDDGC